MIVLRRLSALGTNSDGVSMVEFALIAPVMLGLLLGLFDLGFNIYTATQLEGAVQRAARDSTLEGAIGTTSAIDARVTEAVHEVMPGSTLTFSRKAYANFADVAKPEDYTDVDGDGACDNGEPFEDANGNGVWDADQGVDGRGAARDAVLYTVAVSYPRLFPVASLLGMSPTATTQAETVLRNQPYASARGAPKVLNCP